MKTSSFLLTISLFTLILPSSGNHSPIDKEPLKMQLSLFLMLSYSYSFCVHAIIQHFKNSILLHGIINDCQLTSLGISALIKLPCVQCGVFLVSSFAAMSRLVHILLRLLYEAMFHPMALDTYRDPLPLKKRSRPTVFFTNDLICFLYVSLFSESS